MKTPARNTLQMSLPIRPWLSVRFSQPILVRPLRQAEPDFREAHSAGMLSARVRSNTLAAAPHASRLLDPDNRSRNGALPHRFSPREERALNHTTR